VFGVGISNKYVLDLLGFFIYLCFMDDQEKKRLLWFMNYIKTHPFPVKCLSEKQAAVVTELQSQPDTENNVEAIYRTAEDEQIFQYEKVVYYEYCDHEKQMKCIGIIYSDEDFNWLQPNASSPHRFSALASHFGFDDLNISYSHMALIETAIDEFRGDPFYNFLEI
jgi:hypothetical protein